MKYIVTDKMGEEEIFLFPQRVKHDDFASMMRLSMNIVSAGFVSRSEDGRLNCYGKSIKLKKESRPEEDLDLILKQFSFSM